MGESIEDLSRFLDHSSLTVTTVYLRRLEGQQDLGWAKVAAAIGVGEADPPGMLCTNAQWTNMQREDP